MTVLLPVVIVPLLLTVFTDWCPRFADWMVRRAAGQMPQSHQDRCAEEWQAILADTLGGLSKLAVAVGYWAGVPLLRRAIGASAFRFPTRIIQRLRRRGHAETPARLPEKPGEVIWPPRQAWHAVGSGKSEIWGTFGGFRLTISKAPCSSIQKPNSGRAGGKSPNRKPAHRKPAP